MGKRKKPQFTDADLRTKPWIPSVVLPSQQSVTFVSGKKSIKPSVTGKAKTYRKPRSKTPP